MLKKLHSCKCWDGSVTLLLRLTLGLLFLIAGVNKFRNGVSATAQQITEQFQGSLLPGWFVAPYAWALPSVEVGLGLLLLAGLFTRCAFFATALLTISLMLGMLLLGQTGVAANNALYVLLAILGVRWSSENCCSLDGLLKTKDAGQ